ncbi:hypothetical protein BDY24DRAFT_395577, partial [Mrakia frigida]|uniref:uncharacterized protein n=1 Tax=Mrakia frigida TaxID=29902 RepID=UPI003FCC0AF5
MEETRRRVLGRRKRRLLLLLLLLRLPRLPLGPSTRTPPLGREFEARRLLNSLLLERSLSLSRFMMIFNTIPFSL